MHPSFSAPDEELVFFLRQGCFYKPKRWSGDTGGLEGLLDEAKTDAFMLRAAERIESLLRSNEGLLGMLEGEGEAYRNGYRAGHNDGYRLLEPRIPLDD